MEGKAFPHVCTDLTQYFKLFDLCNHSYYGVILQESICSKFKQAKNLLLKTGLKLKTEKESRIAAERNLFVGFKPKNNLPRQNTTISA